MQQSGLLTLADGQRAFLSGVNLGNVHFVPFAANPYGYTAARMRAILDGALADIAATGANSVRFWLHIDGRTSPSWGQHQVTAGGAAVCRSSAPS
jgi:hypothetical protein